MIPRSGLGLRVTLVLALALAGCALSPPAEVFEQEGQRSSAPARALVTGVPFVSWNEAARLWYRDRDRANPSSHAAFLMVLGYWGQHWALTEDREAMRRWGVSEARRAGALDELKPFIAAGLPVVVPSAVTPVAHPVSPARRALAAARGLAVGGGSASGVLGTMAPLETLDRLGPAPGSERWEPLLAAFRVVIGYDDATSMLSLHDPTFGPAWTVGYAEFERMWALTDRAYFVMRPHQPSAAGARAPGDQEYRPRTLDEAAALDLVHAYALAAAGRSGEAQDRLTRAVARPGLSPGYEHLLRLELATQLAARGRVAAAVAEAERAAALLPEHHRPWAVLAELHRRQGPGDAERAAEAEARARTLAACADLAAPPPMQELRTLPEGAYLAPQRTVAAMLARDFFVTLVCPDSGATWLLRPPP